jgi:fatty aldehyde-generating acyl-ACP reductase
MGIFAYIDQPITEQEFIKRFPVTKFVPEAMISGLLRFAPPYRTGYLKVDDAKKDFPQGLILACPFTRSQMATLPEILVKKKLIRASRLAQKQGADFIGLGPYPAILGDAVTAMAHRLKIPVTTGKRYTVIAAIEGMKMAAAVMGHSLDKVNVVLIGAETSCGGVCASLLASEVNNLTLVGENEAVLHRIAEHILYEYGLVTRISMNIKLSLKNADIVIINEAPKNFLVRPADLKIGAVVCDMSFAKNCSNKALEARNDVLIIDGGLIELPGDLEFEFNGDSGSVQRRVCAGLAETIILAMQKEYKNFTLERESDLKKVIQIRQMAKKHGFKVVGFHRSKQAVTENEINCVRNNVKRFLVI